jgi:hypothetical protein
VLLVLDVNIEASVTERFTARAPEAA